MGYINWEDAVLDIVEENANQTASIEDGLIKLVTTSFIGDARAWYTCDC